LKSKDDKLDLRPLRDLGLAQTTIVHPRKEARDLEYRTLYQSVKIAPRILDSRTYQWVCSKGPYEGREAALSCNSGAKFNAFANWKYKPTCTLPINNVDAMGSTTKSEEPQPPLIPLPSVQEGAIFQWVKNVEHHDEGWHISQSENTESIPDALDTPPRLERLEAVDREREGATHETQIDSTEDFIKKLGIVLSRKKMGDETGSMNPPEPAPFVLHQSLEPTQESPAGFLETLPLARSKSSLQDSLLIDLEAEDVQDAEPTNMNGYLNDLRDLHIGISKPSVMSGTHEEEKSLHIDKEKIPSRSKRQSFTSPDESMLRPTPKLSDSRHDKMVYRNTMNQKARRKKPQAKCLCILV
jgi:hypothetical protein